jgi:hypothetical protein
MKKVLILLGVVMALASCTSCKWEWHDKVLGVKLIEASKTIVTKTYNLKPFEEITMRCVGNMEVIQSDTKNGVVELTAPDNYIELFKFESDNGTLDIDFSRNGVNIHDKNVMIKVYTTDLIAFKNSGAANVSIGSLDTDKLYLKNTGVGHFTIHKLIANEVEVSCSGVGDINISGQTDDASLTCSGVGNILAEDLKALNVKALVSGIGNITCHASEKIEGKVSGVGSLKYAGHPKHKQTSHPGAGHISEL